MSVISDNKHFEQLVKASNPIGEIIGVDHFIVKVKGLHPVSIHTLVMFQNGEHGYVNSVLNDYVIVLYLGHDEPEVGSMVVVQSADLVCKVGKQYIGRTINATGDPIDGKGPITMDAVWPVFNSAPPIREREELTVQLETGVTAIDSLFPIVRGQRMALLGDSRSGKTTLATQITINQKNTDQVVIYVLIAKKRSDVNTLLSRLEQSGSMSKAIVIVTTTFESLVLSYLAPYIACSMAEYLWQILNQDTIIIYDDLTNHAHVYREISLIAGTNPGRESYPGGMFHTHSQLLERAGRLSKNKKHQTAIPILVAEDSDVTGFLTTNVMSVTDGQWILDMDTFRKSIRPAISLGLSVTRIGQAGQNERQKQLSSQTLKTLADFRQAEEFSHFGTELALETKAQLKRGKRILDLITQGPLDTFSLMSQQLMLDIILRIGPDAFLDLNLLKQVSATEARKIKDDKDYAPVLEDLILKTVKSSVKAPGT